jgi:hypothetical protein
VNDTTWSTIVATWRPGRLELDVDGWSRAWSTAAATSTSALFGYIFTLDDLPAADATRDLRARPSGWDTAGRHVLLAASKVLGTTSQLEVFEGEMDPADGPFKAVTTSLPLPRLRVKLEGDPRNRAGPQGLGHLTIRPRAV